jgi:hypothetical protein
MSAGKYSFTIEQGTTYRFGIEYTDASGSAIDLRGYDMKMQIRSDYADNRNTLYTTLYKADIDIFPTASCLYFSGSAGIAESASIAGQIAVYISNETTAGFNFEEAYYDLELYSGDNVDAPMEVHRLIEGTILNKKEVTRV